MSAMREISNAPSVAATVAQQRFGALILLESNACNGHSRAPTRETSYHRQGKDISHMRTRVYPLRVLLFMNINRLKRC